MPDPIFHGVVGTAHLTYDVIGVGLIDKRCRYTLGPGQTIPAGHVLVAVDQHFLTAGSSYRVEVGHGGLVRSMLGSVSGISGMVVPGFTAFHAIQVWYFEVVEELVEGDYIEGTSAVLNLVILEFEHIRGPEWVGGNVTFAGSHTGPILPGDPSPPSGNRSQASPSRLLSGTPRVLIGAFGALFFDRFYRFGIPASTPTAEITTGGWTDGAASDWNNAENIYIYPGFKEGRDGFEAASTLTVVYRIIGGGGSLGPYSLAGIAHYLPNPLANSGYSTGTIAGFGAFLALPSASGVCNLIDDLGRLHVANATDEGIRFRRSDFALPPWALDTLATTDGSDQNPQLDRGSDSLALVFERGPDTYETHSTDDGATWEAPTLMFADASHPIRKTDPVTGAVLSLAYRDGGLVGVREYAGEVTVEFDLLGEDEVTPLAVVDDSFGLDVEPGGELRWVLSVYLDGDTDVSTLASKDDGLTWKAAS